MTAEMIQGTEPTVNKVAGDNLSISGRPLARREFLRAAAAVSAAGIVLLGTHAWAARSSGDDSSRRRLVVIFLRGAVDGLNVVVPYGDSQYYDQRPNIAIPRPGGGDTSVINLDGHFGLHPALGPLMPQWNNGTLAFIHACGSPDPTRSHFDAQDYMESGTPGVRTTADGWMNRVLAVLPGFHGPTEAISVGATVPRILTGRMAVANIQSGRAAARPLPMDNPQIENAFGRLYAGADPLSENFREGQAARKRLLGEIEQDMAAADGGAPSAEGLAGDTSRLARLIQRDPTIRLAFLAVGGWDTHVNEGSFKGQLANHLQPLGEGVASFAGQLGPAYADTVILVISEFGRTVHENGDGGTDHGHGNVMWVMGGPIRGRQVYGDWNGLALDALYQERDIPVTTDFREPISAVLREHMGLTSQQLATIFPDAPPPSGNLGRLLRS